MIFNPPLRQNNAEVTSINEENNTMHLLFYVNAASPMQAGTPELHAMIQTDTNSMIRYLELEGYIAAGKPWIISAGVILYKP